VDAGVGPLHNGDGLTYFDLQEELVGVLVNRATPLSVGGDSTPASWRIEPNEPMANLRDLRPGTALARNRDRQWLRTLEGKTAERRIGVHWRVFDDDGRLQLSVSDEDGNQVCLSAPQDFTPAQNPAGAAEALHQCLAKLGSTIFSALTIEIAWTRPRFIPAAAANAWRRQAIASLEATRGAALARLPRSAPTQTPPHYPQDSLNYLGNVANARAAAFYARHGVQFIEAAYESHQELGDVSLMITKHCVRYSLALCPKQAKGVTGVQGTVRAEPMTLINGKERLRLEFDCKACEMHVVGRIKDSVRATTQAIPVRFAALARERVAPQPHRVS